MDPIHSISDILKHALERNEKISIFKAHLTTVEAKINRSHKMPIQIVYYTFTPEEPQKR